jgi:hypothetical protein
MCGIPRTRYQCTIACSSPMPSLAAAWAAPCPTKQLALRRLERIETFADTIHLDLGKLEAGLELCNKLARIFPAIS